MGGTRRVFRGLPAVHDDAPVPSVYPPAHHPPLLLHEHDDTTCTQARTRARDRSPSSYLTALVRPAGRPAKLRTGIIEKLEPAAAAAGSSVERVREWPRKALLRNTHRRKRCKMDGVLYLFFLISRT